MKKHIIFFIASVFLLPLSSLAQFESFKDSVVQLYGIVMTADSLKGVPSASVVVKGQNRGTITNNNGVFSIVVLKGDQIEFTSIGFKPKQITIPSNLEGNQYSVIQLMVNDTVFLAATIIKSRPSRQQFERDFINTQVPADNLEIARQNNDENKRRVLMTILPRDGKESSKNFIGNQSAKTYYAGQAAPQNIFNPFAWNEFIKAWKRGDFKKKTR